MVTVTGREAVHSYIARLPREIEAKLLRGAGRAGINVIAEEARERCISPEVRGVIKTKVRTEPGMIRARCTADMGLYNLPLWLEYGTSPHFISVDDSQRGGLGLRRINTKVGEAGGNGSLVIGGKFVGATVWHPGARAHPFMRPALDSKRDEALAAAQGFINSRISRGRIVATEARSDG